MQQPFVSTPQIAEGLGVSRQRAYQLIRHPDFPAPTFLLGSKSVWNTTQVKKWAKVQGRTWIDE